MDVRRLALATALLLALAAPAAQAAPDQAALMMDDDQLLYRSDAVQTRTLVRMKSIGVEAVRATVLWRVVAEGASMTNAEIRRLRTGELRDRARRQRARFRPADPRTYPTRNWDRYDNLVKQAAQLGMRVYFTITGPGPHYAHRKAPPSQRTNAGTYKPYPTRFRSFVEAVGRRYSGTYRDENGVRRPLPRVTLWSLWNEPNQPGWLTPQWENRGGKTVPASPGIYRQLYQAGYDGLVRSGHGGDAILLAETAPLGSTSRGPRNGIRPVPFLRELLCLTPAGVPYAGPDATLRGCDDFARRGPLKATAFAHHPYTKKDPPTKPPASPDEITMGNLHTLAPLLDRLAAQSGGRMPANLPIFLTEFGYESNPPDPRNGISLADQARFNQLGELIAYRDPRVHAITQFLLRDVGPARQYARGSRLYWLTYQSGLFTLTGRPKPAAVAYALPFVVYPTPGDPTTMSFWGQLRFRPNGRPDIAVVMWRPAPTAPWVQVGAAPTSFRGFFAGAVALPGVGGQWRAVYVDQTTARITNTSLAVTP